MDLNQNNMDRLEQIKNIADQLIGQGNLNIVDSAFFSGLYSSFRRKDTQWT
ncbi:MAG: hypothetical protein RBR32_10880 [Bacteroidales bacterium]|nr:hypothetical protein [Bacteroidales bacterium]